MPPQTSRRRFLQSSALVLGAASLARAATGAPAVRVAVVGTGGRGCDLLRALATTERANVVAICDDYEPHLERGQEYAGPQAKPFSNYEKMLAEVRPQAVVIATPLVRHFAMSMAALDAGCAVFCEKTMCYAVDEAQQLAAEVAKRGAIFQVGLQRRANAIYAQAQAMVEAGMLGRISAIKCQWHRNNNWRRPVPVPRGDADWNALERRLNWRLYEASSRGLMAELASHQLDVANRLLGTLPRRVFGSGGIDYWRDGREVCDNVFCLYEYEVPLPAAADAAKPAGTPHKKTYTVRVTYSSVQNNAYEGASELVLGDRGTLFLTQKKGLFFREPVADNPGWTKEGRVERDAAIITSGKTLKMSNDPWSGRGKPYEIDTRSDDTRDELIAFLDCVQRDDPQTLCDANVGLENAKTILLGHRAIHTGQAVQFAETNRSDA